MEKIIYWALITSVRLICTSAMPSLSFSHQNFDMTRFNSIKGEDLLPPKLSPSSITKLSFSTSPKLLDPIDEGNFWINPHQQLEHHYDALKTGQTLKNSETYSNPENIPIWFGFPNSFLKTSPKLERSEKIITSSNEFYSESKDQNNHKKSTVSKSFLPENKFGINLKAQEESSSDKNTKSDKNDNIGQIPDDKSDIDISDLLIFDELTDKFADSTEEKGKEEIEKQTIVSKVSPIQQQRTHFIPLKKMKITPISSSSFDFIKKPHQKSRFSTKNPLERHSLNLNIVNDVGLEDNEIKVYPREHLNFSDNAPVFLLNNLKKIPLHFSNHLEDNLLRSEDASEINNISRPLFSMMEISVLSPQTHVKEFESHPESLKLHNQDSNSKILNPNPRTLQPDSKVETSLNKIGNSETRKNQISKVKEEAKDKKKIEKLSNHDLKELCKKYMDKYPKLYQFLENFSDKIVEAALRYEIASQNTNLLNKTLPFESSQRNNNLNSTKL